MNKPEADVAAIMTLYEQYCVGINTNNLDLFMEVWSEGAIRMGQDTPAVIGKDQVRAYFQSLFDAFNTRVVIYGETEVLVSDDMASGWGTATLEMTPRDGGSTTLLYAKWLDVLQRQADGSWKIHRDSVTNDGPPKVG